MEYYKNKKIWVTGGSGLIGSHLVRKLNEMGAIVSAPLHITGLQQEGNARGYDLTKVENIVEILSKNDFEIIFHCAAKSEGAKRMKENPKRLVTPNVVMTSLLLDCAQEYKVKGFVYLSSTAVDLPDEYPGVAPMLKFGEELCKFYRDEYGMRVTAVRPCNAYGPNDKFDERSHFIPALIKKAIAKEDPFVVWGTGKNLRNVIYVEDLVEGILEAHEANYRNPVTIGAERAVTVDDVLYKILKLTDYKANVVYDTSKPDAAKSNAAVIDMVKNKTSLEEGLRKTIKYYKEEILGVKST